MGKLVLPHTRPQERPTGPIRPVGPLRGRGWFVWRALRLGGQRFGSILGLAGLAIGITVSYLVTVVFDLPAPWAVAIIVALLFAVSVEGGYRLWEREQATAMRFRPTWEILQDRVDILSEMFDANYSEGSDWAKFIQQNYLGEHREAARRDFDIAETAGYPVRIQRDDLRRPRDADSFREVIGAFQDAADRWKDMERANT